MNNFEKELINTLLDKYESSKISKGGTSVKRSVKLTTKDDTLKTYTLLDSYKYIDDNDEVIKRLTRLGYIFSEYNNDTFKSLTLNIDNVDSLYEYIRREKPSKELERIKNVLSTYIFDNFLIDFINYVNDYITTKYDYPKTYFEDSIQLELILNTFKYIFSLDEEIKKRDFSVKYLKDSKKFESIENKIVRIIKDFDDKEYLTHDEVLEAYNIVKNSTYVLIKNKLIFKINDQVIDLNKFRYEFSLSDSMIKNMQIINSDIKKIITIENLTSFYSFSDESSLVIYLAGFQNHTRQNLLNLIYKAYPRAEYYHFSDIDCGGFLIFNDLKEKTKIPFIPYRMNIEELKSAKVLKELTKNDRSKLVKMLDDSKFSIFYETIKYMLDNNVKLEQEILD